MSRAGYDTIGVAGREENFACSEYVAGRLALANLHFVNDDVRNRADYGRFDAVLCNGLLYHLDAPSAYIDLLSRCTRRLAIVQTHFAADTEPEGCTLGVWTTHEGRRGRWYVEIADDVDEAMLGASRWASIGNRKSFWLEKGELVQALRRAGFDLTYEQYDFVDDMRSDDYLERYSRSMFVGVRTTDLTRNRS